MEMEFKNKIDEIMLEKIEKKFKDPHFKKNGIIFTKFVSDIIFTLSSRNYLKKNNIKTSTEKPLLKYDIKDKKLSEISLKEYEELLNKDSLLVGQQIFFEIIEKLESIDTYEEAIQKEQRNFRVIVGDNEKVLELNTYEEAIEQAKKLSILPKNFNKPCQVVEIKNIFVSEVILQDLSNNN